ncbi:uncharacterized protein [Branchiostoma lanceolatum]|uniref:uncharacterized protein isoform X2 n=1 Tax=Branchiostoma lanceolatum TaxID=7740 RepID=UPI003454A75C
MAPGLEIQRQTGQGARRVIDEGKTLHIENKLYSATFVYDDKDLPWVTCAVHYLEENYDQRIYYRGRDATPGHPITDNSIDSITNSNVVIVAISNAFLNNCWAKKEEGWALLHSVKTGGCKMLPVLLEDCELPKELSDLETLSLASVKKCHEEYLKRLGIGLHKLLTPGQCQRAKLTFDPDGNVGDEKDGKAVEPSDTVPFNGSEPDRNGTLVCNNAAMAAENKSNTKGSPPDRPLLNLQES